MKKNIKIFNSVSAKFIDTKENRTIEELNDDLITTILKDNQLDVSYFKANIIERDSDIVIFINPIKTYIGV